MILRRTEGVDLLGKLEPHCQYATLYSSICRILFLDIFCTLKNLRKKLNFVLFMHAVNDFTDLTNDKSMFPCKMFYFGVYYSHTVKGIYDLQIVAQLP